MSEAVGVRNALKIEETTSKKFAKSKVIYFFQVVIIYIVVIASLINLSIQQHNQTLWSSLLSACIGYVLPSPQLRDDNDNKKQEDKNESLLPNPTEQ